MFHVGKVDECKFAVPERYEAHSQGYERLMLIDAACGSVHMGVGICELQPNGHVDTRVQANEKGLYVLEGKLEVKRARETFRLSTDDYALIPYGIAHAFRNTSSRTVRWLEMQAPQPKPPGGWQDTFFVDEETPWPAEVARPDFESGTPGSTGRYIARDAIAPHGGFRGLAVHRFMLPTFGAHQFLMMRGELSPGGFRGYHDHPLEEFYFALSGEAFMDIDGQRVHLRPGDVAWTGVGTPHAFYHTGHDVFRWLETQAPQFPARNGARDYADWDKFKKN